MNDRHELNVKCEGCGETFEHFLEEISEHNKTVVCPSCGAAHDPKDAQKGFSTEKP